MSVLFAATYPERVSHLILFVVYATASTTDEAFDTFVTLTVAALFGATAIGWNGVQLAEVARLSPRGAVAAVQGAAGFVTFSGVVAGPPLFALIASSTGSYRVSFAVVAIVSAIGAVWMALAARPRSS